MNLKHLTNTIQPIIIIFPSKKKPNIFILNGVRSQIINKSLKTKRAQPLNWTADDNNNNKTAFSYYYVQNDSFIYGGKNYFLIYSLLLFCFSS